MPVALGLGVSGVTAYGFLAITSRVLGPSAYAPVSVLWTLVFVAAPGLFLPLEQEMGRLISSRRAVGVGSRPVVLRTAATGVVLAAAVVVAALLAHKPLVSRLFDGQASFLGAFVAAVVAYLLFYLVRGVLAGSAAFRSYGALVSVDGIVRMVAVATLAGAGLHAAGAYGLLVGLPALAGAAAGLALFRRGVGKGPPVGWAEIGNAVGLLVAGQLFAQVLVNAGPLAVKVLATPVEQAVAGTFLNGLVIARIPLFLFQAVQASLLPSLAAQAAGGRLDHFRRGLQRLMVAVAGVALLAVLACAALGPFVVSHFFGAGFRLDRLDMTLLATGSGLYMVALGLVQGVIALRGHRLVPLVWLIGDVTFLAVAGAIGAAGHMGVARRVELSFTAGSLVSLLAVAVVLQGRLARARQVALQVSETLR